MRVRYQDERTSLAPCFNDHAINGSIGHPLIPLPLVIGHTAAVLFARGEGAHAVGPCISAGRAAPIRVLHVNHGRAADQQHQSAQGESQSSQIVLRVGARSRPEAG
jgi:hypothetical protein